MKCANCDQEFVKKRPNQIYCSDACCKETTNKRILARYHENKARKKLIRNCAVCNIVLSRYNDDDECYSCQLKAKDQERFDLFKKLGFEYKSE